MTSCNDYYMVLVWPDGCWDRLWSQSYAAVKHRFDTIKAIHPEAIGSIVRLRVKPRLRLGDITAAASTMLARELSKTATQFYGV